MEIKVNNYKLRIDEENLEKISSGNKLIYSPHWQNYLEVVESKQYAGKFFKNLGISPAQAMDFAMLGGKDGKIEYYIIYILPGEILEGQTSWIKKGTGYQYQGEILDICEDMKISFQKEIFKLPNPIDAPLFQMNVWIHLPWILEE